MSTQSILSIVILTRNEEANLPVCLESLRSLRRHIYVVDSGSTDRTLDIARSFGCKIVSHEFENHASQLNWVLEHIPITTPWVMRLDADERLTPELAEEITQTLPLLDENITGLRVKRRVYFWGKWIKRGGFYPTWLLRVWRNGVARCEPRWMDEHMVLNGGQVNQLQHDIIDENQKGLGFWTEKHNQYADREVRDMLSLSKRENTCLSLSGQAGNRRWMKVNIYSRFPLFFRAFIYWFYRYFFRLGVLDGLPGLVFHFLQGFWYQFLVDAKLYEYEIRGRKKD